MPENWTSLLRGKESSLAASGGLRRRVADDRPNREAEDRPPPWEGEPSRPVGTALGHLAPKKRNLCPAPEAPRHRSGPKG